MSGTTYKDGTRARGIAPDISLPTLVSGIYRDGRLINLSEIADPRAAFCADWNKLATDSRAVPLTAIEAAHARKVLAESEASHHG